MTRFEYINKNIESIKDFSKVGIASTAVLKHWQIYSRYDYYRKLNNSKEVSGIFVQDEFNITRRWFLIIKKSMENEI
jgi:hypothetical protein